jgi:hypothetical protein
MDVAHGMERRDQATLGTGPAGQGQDRQDGIDQELLLRRQSTAGRPLMPQRGSGVAALAFPRPAGHGDFQRRIGCLSLDALRGVEDSHKP